MSQGWLRNPSLAAVAALAALVSVLPMFGSTAYASGLDLDGVVAVTEFSFPGAPVSKTTAKVTSAQTAPFLLNIADNATLFPESGELLLDLTELVVYDNGGPLPAACSGRTSTQVCVTTRAKVGSAKQHPSGTEAKLATQLTANLSGTPAQGTLETSIPVADDPPLPITVTNQADFGTSGFITISHQDTDAGGVTTEYIEFNRSCGSAGQLCLISRARQSNKLRSNHPADGYAQPGGTPGRSIVDKHDQIQVKSNADFFPTGNLIIYTIHTQQDPLGGDAELIEYANVQNIKTPAATEFHIASRGASPSTFKTTPIVSHAAGSIVTGADQLIVARQKYESPIPGLESSAECDAACVANSVGTFQVAYTQYQPNGSPKILDPKQLTVPLVGQPVIILNALNQPFTSTGGFRHLLFGEVPLVDTDGTKDGVLHLISPCITDFTPGTNLQITATVQLDKNYATPDTGEITVVFDTVTGPGGGRDGNPSTHDDCDDPASASTSVLTNYIYPGDGDTSDDDTDGDGCTDAQELSSNIGTGGARDPWNPGDFFDANKDGSVTTVDIFAVAAKFGATSGGGPPYDANHDRGLTYGPFGHNLSAADGAIAIPDIFAVAAQFGHAC